MDVKLMLTGGSIGLTLFLYLAWVFVPVSRNQYKADILLERVETGSSWHDQFGVLHGKLAKDYFTQQREELEKLIVKSGVDTTPEKIFVERIVYPIMAFILFGTFYLIFKATFLLITAVVLAVYFFIEPKSKLTSKAKARHELIQKETPNFALTVRLLLRGQQSPVDALKLACSHGVGDGLRDYAEILNNDLDHMHPVDAIQKFAWSIEVPELIEFASNISQYMIIGKSEDGEEILRQMEVTFRDLDKKMLERERETRPKKLKAINFVLLANGVFFIMAALVMFLLELMSGGLM